ncbi:MAG TPA: GNAT family N-acetyltransferase [Armatimonadetes bacterium]|jgi:GNAT superfamily N-acetyltransferase|nr:GNAT family N-acetyltransferase [Armatimonadota bacterium]
MPQDLRRQALASVLPQDYRLDRLGVTIRAAQPSDLPTISCLRPDEPDRARRRLDSQQSGHVLYLLALINNLPVGTALLHWQSITRVPLGASISDLYVIPQLRGLGIGTQLLKASEALARAAGIHQISLAVNPTENRRVRHYYERLGYRDPGGQTYLNATHTQVDEYGNEHVFEDWVVDMVKRL